jgi:hypothetical protein
MTKNQLDYQKNVETRRHNLMEEQIGATSARASEVSAQGALLRGSAAVTSAAAAVTQAQTAQARLAEDIRHNKRAEVTESRKATAQEINAATNIIASVADTFT